MHENLLDRLFDYGPLAIALFFIGWGFWRSSKWIAELVKDALLHPENGWLAIAKRNADNLQRNVDQQGKFLADAAARDEAQQALCTRHAETLQQLSVVLEQHLELSRATLTAVEELRNDLREIE